MLKEKYSYRLLFVEAKSLQDSFSKVFELYGQTKEIRLMLPISILKDVQKRLIGSLSFPEDKIKFSLKRNEALAFHALYMSNVIETSFVTQQINTEIHKTL